MDGCAKLKPVAERSQTAAETKLSDQVVCITGAAGGLGQGLCSQFASQGWKVVEASHHLSGRVESSRVLPVVLDVLDADASEHLVRTVVEKWGRIDAWINNAGVTADSLLSQLSEQDWDRVLDVNLKGAFLCARAVVPTMIRQVGGHIVNVASFSARSGPQGQANYAAAKAGLIGFTQALAREIGPHNVRINAVLPGVLPTPMTKNLAPETLEHLARANSLCRLNSVAEVARFIAFLVSTQNISGQILQLDSRIARWT